MNIVVYANVKNVDVKKQTNGRDSYGSKKDDNVEKT